MSSIPTALDALVAALRLAPDLSDVTIYDGPVGTNQEQDELIIGDGPDAVAVDGDQSPEGLNSQVESYDIACRATVWRGDVAEAKPVRDRLFEIYAAVETTLRSDPTLAGAVLSALPSAQTLSPRQENAGLLMDLVFTIRVSAFA